MIGFAIMVTAIQNEQRKHIKFKGKQEEAKMQDYRAERELLFNKQNTILNQLHSSLKYGQT